MDKPRNITNVRCRIAVRRCSVSPQQIRIDPEKLFSPLSLQALARRVIVNKSVNYEKVNSVLKEYILNEGNPIELSHFSTRPRYNVADGKALVPDHEVNVSGFPLHPMESLTPVLPYKFDITSSAKRYYQFQQQIIASAELGETEFVEHAVRRYELFMELQESHPNLILNPPLDIAAVWLSHLIRPASYRKWNSSRKQLIDCQLLRSDFEAVAAKNTAELWKQKFGKDEPFEHHAHKKSIIGDLFSKKLTPKNAPGMVLACEVTKDRKWLHDLDSQVGTGKVLSDEALLPNLIAAYELFLYHHAKYPSLRTTPPVPVDLIWHTHMCYPQHYLADMTRIVGDPTRMDHVPWPTDREVLYSERQAKVPFEKEFNIDMDTIIRYPQALAKLKFDRAREKHLNRCTYRFTKKRFVQQEWYACETCNLVDSLGCCDVCATRCHAGHKVVRREPDACFCDCGAGEAKSPCSSL